MSSSNSILKTFVVATLLCIVCSVIVSGAAVSLRPTQQIQKALDKKKNILAAAGLFTPGMSDVDGVFTESIEAKVVDLATGEYSAEFEDAASFSQRDAAKDPARSIEIAEDFAGIGRRSKLASIYIVKKDGKIDRLILPIHGKGLWSTLYGFLAVDADLNTVKALNFYEHAETPGLGGEVDNPSWKALWDGKKIFSESGNVKLTVIKGKVDAASSQAMHQVDGLSGATITARGVGNMIKYWLGEDGYGKFLANAKAKGELS